MSDLPVKESLSPAAWMVTWSETTETSLRTFSKMVFVRVTLVSNSSFGRGAGPALLSIRWMSNSRL